jgi:hypothetical protein
MRLPSLRTWPFPLVVGEDTYQEFTAGTIPVRRVMAEDPVSPGRGAPRRGADGERRLRRDVDGHDRRRDPADGDPARAQDRRPAGTPPAAVHGPRDDALVAVRRRRVARIGAPSQRRRTLVVAGRHLGARPDPRPGRPASSPDAGRGASPGDAPATAVSATAVLAESRGTAPPARQIIGRPGEAPSTGRDASRHRETKLKGDDHA